MEKEKMTARKSNVKQFDGDAGATDEKRKLLEMFLNLPPALRSIVLEQMRSMIREKSISIQYFNLTSREGELFDLMPSTLRVKVEPLLEAIKEIQYTIDKVMGHSSHEFRIKSITQESPISVSLEGAAEAVQVMKDTIVPSCRKHAETMALLQEKEKQADIETKNAEILEKRASAAKGRAEADKLAAEADKQRVETERIKLENEKLRLELQQAKIQMALNILNQYAPNLSETERINHVIQLLRSIDLVISSKLELVDVTSENQ
ncbi:MAG: hypothetical protein HZB51_16190 [Chloroflexi bacterium]|nr:hypothetical protein [Chloroflexota bacterium]